MPNSVYQAQPEKYAQVDFPWQTDTSEIPKHIKARIMLKIDHEGGLEPYAGYGFSFVLRDLLGKLADLYIGAVERNNRKLIKAYEKRIERILEINGFYEDFSDVTDDELDEASDYLDVNHQEYLSRFLPGINFLHEKHAFF